MPGGFFAAVQDVFATLHHIRLLIRFDAATYFLTGGEIDEFIQRPLGLGQISVKPSLVDADVKIQGKLFITGRASMFVVKAANPGEFVIFVKRIGHPPDKPRASALGMDIVKTGRFAQILGRKAPKKHLSSGVNLPFFAISK